jgi:hypothetical protein
MREEREEREERRESNRGRIAGMENTTKILTRSEATYRNGLTPPVTEIHVTSIWD